MVFLACYLPGCCWPLQEVSSMSVDDSLQILPCTTITHADDGKTISTYSHGHGWSIPKEDWRPSLNIDIHGPATCYPAIAMKSADTQHITQAHSASQRILMDCGSNFVGKLLRHLYSMLGVGMPMNRPPHTIPRLLVWWRDLMWLKSRCYVRRQQIWRQMARHLPHHCQDL